MMIDETHRYNAIVFIQLLSKIHMVSNITWMRMYFDVVSRFANDAE
jgi:hypothetical protein